MVDIDRMVKTLLGDVHSLRSACPHLLALGVETRGGATGLLIESIPALRFPKTTGKKRYNIDALG
jgi:hypothetical protein